MREQVCKAREGFPLSGCGRESSVESRVEYQCFSGGVRHRPKIANRVASKKRLREVPDFSRQSELSAYGMRNRKCLPELSAPHGTLHQFIEKLIHVVVKSLHIGAGQESDGVGGSAKIQIGSITGVHAMKIADGDRRFRALARAKHRLRAQQHISGAICRAPIGGGMRNRRRRCQKLQARSGRELHHFGETVLRGKLGRVSRSQYTRFKLKISNGRKSRGSRNRGAAWIRLWFVRRCGLRGARRSEGT